MDAWCWGMKERMDGWMKRLFKVKWLYNLAGKDVEFWDNERTNPWREGLRTKEQGKKILTPMAIGV